MVRAAAAAEKAGFRSVSIATSGFVQQAHAIAKALGMANLAVAEYPGVVMMDGREELRRKVTEVLVDNVIAGLAAPAQQSEKPSEPGSRDIVFKGSLKEVQEFFHRNLWSDGLPVIPPTLEEVHGFLRFTDRSPDEVIGVLLPENRQATVWNTAVNGVMAGCRPEYMPVLIAIVEAIADPEFGIEHAGSTPGWEPLIVLNGPISKELDFNCGSGVLRIGRQANSSVGRFLRLYMRNVAGLRIPPGATDKATFGYTFNAVLAENEDAVAEMGWQPFSVDRGFAAGENVVTVQSAVSISPACYSGGDTPESHMEAIGEIIGRGSIAYRMPTAAKESMAYPLIAMSPSVAGVIAKGGWTKNDVRQWLYDNVRVPAGLFEKLAWHTGKTTFSFRKYVEEGLISRDFWQSDDPNRLVPVFLKPEWTGIVVSGDPGRNQSKGYAQNQKQGVPVSKRIVLPRSWGPGIRG
ncbi:MAG: hypothetical protein HYX92_16860 [Chloroflexi bacterium]|nr:hypothetical protein [Chloroflexota bacterium]